MKKIHTLSELLMAEATALSDQSVPMGATCDIQADRVFAGGASHEKGGETLPDQAITADIVGEFLAFAKIARPSGHEMNISNYLMNWAKQYHFRAWKDTIGNVIIDKPAAAGFEDVPLTILQSHMDMVCVAQEGVDFIPEKTPIRVLNDGRHLRADGTSLGADNGIGMAAALYCLKQKNAVHGPLRAIFTVNEEQGMDGATQLSNDCLDARYLINLDWEDEKTLATSSADASVYEFEKTVSVQPGCADRQAHSLMRAFSLKICGLKGGHSGMNIHEGRGNAIKLLSDILRTLCEHIGTVQLATLSGGQADNAIPTEATVVLAVSADTVERAQKIIDERCGELRAMWMAVEPDIDIECMPVTLPGQLIGVSDSKTLIDFLQQAFNGVYAWSPFIQDAVQSSANLGTVVMNGQHVRLTILARSSMPEDTQRMRTCYEQLAAITGFTIHLDNYAPGWPVNPDSRLVDMTRDAFREVTGDIMTIAPVHAALECGWWVQKNPALDIVAIGPKITDPHSPSETVYLDTVAPFIKTLIRVLEKIARSEDDRT